MRTLIRYSKYFIAFFRRIGRTSFYATINEWHKYYKRYVKLTHRISQSLSFENRIFVWQNYLRIVYYFPEIDENKLQKIVPKKIAFNILSLKTNPPSKKIILVDKVVFYRILEEQGINHPKVFFYHKDGVYYNLRGELINNLENFYEKKMFVKALDGSSGAGAEIIVFNKDFYKNNQMNLIFQEIIQTESSIQEIAPVNTTSTVRLNSYLDKKDKLEICSAFIKLALPGFVYDNMRTGSIGVSIDFKTGRLNDEGVTVKGSKDKYGNKITKHPMSNRKFGGFILPYWQETLDMIEKLHLIFYELKFIGWDIAITNNGPIVFEGNSVGDILFEQLISEPYFDTKYIQENII